jgi:hypothetical protein
MADANINIAFANLDFCGNVTSAAMMEDLWHFSQSGCLTHGKVAVTMLRGRELSFDSIKGLGQKEQPHYHVAECEGAPYVYWKDKAPGLSPSDFGRIAVVRQVLCGMRLENVLEGQRLMNTMCAYNTYIRRCGLYRSTAGTQSMLWAIYSMHKTPCGCILCGQSMVANLLASDISAELRAFLQTLKTPSQFMDFAIAVEAQNRGLSQEEVYNITAKSMGLTMRAERGQA